MPLKEKSFLKFLHDGLWAYYGLQSRDVSSMEISALIKATKQRSQASAMHHLYRTSKKLQRKGRKAPPSHVLMLAELSCSLTSVTCVLLCSQCSVLATCAQVDVCCQHSSQQCRESILQPHSFLEEMVSDGLWGVCETSSSGVVVCITHVSHDACSSIQSVLAGEEMSI